MINKHQKEERTGLTVEKVFNKQKYLNIITLVFTQKEKGIRRSQLIESLVKNNKKKPKLTPSELDKEMISKIKLLYDSKKITEEQFIRGTEFFKRGVIQREKEKGNITPESQFTSVLGLRNALIRLKDLGLIKSIKPKYKYSYYILTDYGLILYTKWMINFKINYLIYDPEDLIKINNSLLSYIAKKKIKKKN